MNDWRAMHEQNRRSWNAVTAAHNSHKRDQAKFLSAGGSTLFPEELELLGDVSGRDLAHLQCNCGQDSLSLSQMGAHVTGVAISDRAIDVAQGLADSTGIACAFVRSDLLEWLESTSERFDVAFASYGCAGWISDINRWAHGISRILKPNGQLVYMEFHPLVWSLDATGLAGDSYFVHDPIVEEEGVTDYVGEALAPSGFERGVEGFTNPERAYSFQWPAAAIMQALIDAGMSLNVVREYPYANGCELFEGMQRTPGNRYTLPGHMPSLPLMLGLRAQQPADS